jgi:hypothetical protein
MYGNSSSSGDTAAAQDGGHGMTIAVNPDTCLPLGHHVCLPCAVSWSPWRAPAPYCWCCGQYGQTTTEAVAALRAANSPPPPVR